MENVTLDRLFRPVRGSILVGQARLSIRALSGSERDERGQYATRQARALEKRLEDPESEIYQYQLKMLESMEAETLALMLKERQAAEVRRRLEEDNKPVYLPEPEEASDDEKRQTLAAREQAEAKRTQQIETELKVEADAYQEKVIQGKTQVDLLALVKSQIVSRLLVERANVAYAHYTIAKALQDHDGNPYLKGPEEAAAMDDKVLVYLYRIAREVGEIDPLLLNGPSSTD